MRLVIAGVVIAALSIGGAGAAQLIDRSGGGNKGQASEVARGAATSDQEEKPTAKPLELGTVAKISSNYRAAVVEISRYESATGDFIVAAVKAVYTGNRTGDLWADLIVEFSDSGSRTRGESECRVDIGDQDASDLPELEPGEEATYAVCIDLGGSEIDGAKVSVEEAFAGGNPVRWSTKGAVSKNAPAPEPSAKSAPAAPPQQPSGAGQGASEEQCEKFEDDIDDSREAIDDLDEQIEQFKKVPDYDEDDLEDLEEWRDSLEENVEGYEEVC